MTNTPQTKVIIAPASDTDRLGLSWQSCSELGGTVEYDHKQMLKLMYHCSRCGEATDVTFRPGDRLTLYIKDGDLVRIDVGGKCHILNYAKVKRLVPSKVG